MKLDNFAVGVAPSTAQRLRGIHAATVCPLNPDLSVDEATLHRILKKLSDTVGIRGFLINGHAGENAQLNRSEKILVTNVARDAVGTDFFITTGVYSEDAFTAAAHARDAEEAGADAILVFPPNAWALGKNTDLVVAHHRAIADATSLPILLYQSPVTAAAMPYSVETLQKLAEIPTVAGIKEGSWEVATYEENRLAFKAVRPDAVVLGSGDEHLLAAYILGTEGSQVSLASVIPEPMLELWEASERGDWETARELHRLIYPLATAIYRAKPGFLATARLKACLKIIGLISSDAMRSPGLVVPSDEYRVLEAAIRHAQNR